MKDWNLILDLVNLAPVPNRCRLSQIWNWFLLTWTPGRWVLRKKRLLLTSLIFLWLFERMKIDEMQGLFCRAAIFRTWAFDWETQSRWRDLHLGEFGRIIGIRFRYRIRIIQILVGYAARICKVFLWSELEHSANSSRVSRRTYHNMNCRLSPLCLASLRSHLSHCNSDKITWKRILSNFEILCAILCMSLDQLFYQHDHAPMLRCLFRFSFKLSTLIAISEITPGQPSLFWHCICQAWICSLQGSQNIIKLLSNLGQRPLLSEW